MYIVIALTYHFNSEERFYFKEKNNAIEKFKEIAHKYYYSSEYAQEELQNDMEGYDTFDDYLDDCIEFGEIMDVVIIEEIVWED
jgi:hypothetical protein